MCFAAYCPFTALDVAACSTDAEAIFATPVNDVYLACLTVLLTVSPYPNTVDVGARPLLAKRVWTTRDPYYWLGQLKAGGGQGTKRKHERNVRVSTTYRPRSLNQEKAMMHFYQAPASCILKRLGSMQVVDIHPGNSASTYDYFLCHVLRFYSSNLRPLEI